MGLETASALEESNESTLAAVSELRMKHYYLELAPTMDRFEYSAPRIREAILPSAKPVINLDVIWQRARQLNQALLAFKGQNYRRSRILR
jgi:hypothetical protein